jgi:hypothetical protein
MKYEVKDVEINELREKGILEWNSSQEGEREKEEK